MCTILTISKDFWTNNHLEVVERIESDALFNRDGWSLVCLDDADTENDIQVNSMNVKVIVRTILDFFDESSEYARVFLHARAATTEYRGIGFTHGFSDLNGRIIMHNGIINNPEHLAIDSYALTDLPFALSKMLKFFENRGDTYANCFIIDTVERDYTVLRLSTGSLYTDNQGNFSTNPVGSIEHAVRRWTVDNLLVSDYISLSAYLPIHR